MAKINVKVGGGFEPVPDGVYDCTVFEAEMKQGPKGPYIQWTLQCTEEPFSARRFWVNTSLSTTAAWRLEKMLDNIGCEYTKDDDGNLEFDTDDVIGTPCRAVVKVGEYQGKPKNEVSDVIGMND